MRFITGLLISLFCAPTFAQLNGRIDLSLRTKPLSYNGVLTGAYDGLLWGTVDKTKGMYGFYRAGIRAGGNPTAALFLQVAPVAPVVFEIQKGSTYRFIKTGATDCDRYECLKKIDRTDYSLRLGGAFKNFVFMSKFMIRELETEDGTKPLFLEHETFHVTPGHYYRYFENISMLGYKIDDLQTAGIMYMGGELTNTSAHFYSGYGYYSRKLEWANLTAALGYFENSAAPADVRGKFQGASALILLSRNFGDTLSLF